MNTDESFITVSDLLVKIVRKRIKHLHLAVYPPNGWVRVAAPQQVNDEAIRLAVISRLEWIRKQRKSFENQVRQTTRELVTGESHYYLGKRYLLNVCHTQGHPSVELKNKKVLILNIAEQSTLEACQQVLADWYRQEMKRLLPEVIQKWEDKTGLTAKGYGIKRMKTKWGSCNPSQKRIWLNLELIKKPIHCLEYVVVHELVHLLERTHNDTFIAHMDRIMPQWRTYRDELNNLPLAHENWKPMLLEHISLIPKKDQVFQR